MSVLIVDDNSIDRTVMRACLERSGCKKVEEAEDGTAGLFKFENAYALRTPSDLVLIDWKMPKKDGVALVKNIRETFSKSETTIVMVTSVSDFVHVREALKAGVNDFVIKPIDVKVFGEKLKTLFPGKKSA